METTTQPIETNDLRHSILAHDSEGNPIYIKIELNDDCKNGHQDFSITGDIYEKGKPKTDRYLIGGGCIYEEILKAKPELKIFVDLHLCDYKGIPMHAVANGFYHLRTGFNNTKIEDSGFKAEYCEYYRISPVQFDSLNKSENELQYALSLQNLGILAQWEKQAKEAIAILEEMTGQKFKIDSKRTQFVAPTADQLKEEEEKQDSGYYTAEAIEQRKSDKKQAVLQSLIDDRDKEIKKANTEFEVKAQVLEIGGKAALDNCIYYHHSNTLGFNWKGYGEISDTLVSELMAKVKLPEGGQFENKKK
jgi:hypothetical protein